MICAPARFLKVIPCIFLLIACAFAQTLNSELVITGTLHYTNEDASYTGACSASYVCGTQAALAINGTSQILVASSQYLYRQFTGVWTALPFVSSDWTPNSVLNHGASNKMYASASGSHLIILSANAPGAIYVFYVTAGIPTLMSTLVSTGPRWVAGAFDESGTRFWVVGVDSLSRHAEIGWLTIDDSGATLTRPSAGVYLASDNICRSVTLRKGPGSTQSRMIFGCTGTIAAVPTNVQTGTSFNLNSVTITPVGAGVYMSATYHAGTDTIFLGADIGLGLACNGSDYNIKALFFISSGIDSSSLISVYLDESPSTPVLFWGATTGMVHRTLFPNDYTLELSYDASFGADTAITSISPHPTATHKLLVVAAAKPGKLGSLSGLYTLTKSLCNTFGTNCESCSHDPYCGYCYASGTCNSKEGCNDLWSRSIVSSVCMNALTVTPTSGSVSGHTMVTVSGNYFNVSEKANYFCRWYLNGGGSYANIAIDDIGNDWVKCQSPPQFVAGTSNVGVWWKTNGAIFGGLAPSFDAYTCEGRSCSSCYDASHTECGWCFDDRKCSSREACTSATGSVNPNFAFNQASCPEVSAVAPVSASVAISQPITVSLSGFPNHGHTFKCQFGSESTTVTTSQISGNSVVSVTCNSPTSALVSTEGRDYVSIDIVNATGSPWTGLRRNTFERYDCPGFTQCGLCNSLVHNDCTWCGDSSTCVYESAPGTCSAGASQCPAIHSVAPFSAFLSSHSSLPITITGVNIEDPVAMIFTCVFRLGSDEFTSPATWTSATQAQCTTPSDAGFGLGVWMLHLALDSRQLMDAHEFLVYDCSNSTCATCVDPLQTACVWCASPSNLGCFSYSTGCLSPLAAGTNANLSCPIVSGVEPLQVAFNASVDVVFAGNFTFLQDVDNAGLYCGFGTSAEPVAREFSGSATIAANQLSATCEDVLPITSGAKSAYLYGSLDRVFGDSYQMTVQECEDALNCSACLAISGCHYCAGLCTSNCTVPIHDQLVCPQVHSVTPNFIDRLGDTFVYVNGDGFLPVALDTPGGGGGRKRDSLDYMCHWLPTALAFIATNVTEDFIQCSTPQVDSAMALNLQISLNGLIYAIAPPIEVFVCTDFTDDTCTDACQQTGHCGWCVGIANCAGAERCSDGLWLPSCLTTTLSSTTAALEGNLEIVFTMVGSILPTNFSDTDFECRFGLIVVPSSSLSVDGEGQLISVSCISPPSTQDFPNDVELSLLYRGNKVAETHTFSYVDCGSVKECDRCIATPNCGWCTEGAKRCSAVYQCSQLLAWSNKKCPLNKIALGVGVGVGLFALILILLLVLFLIRRARRKSGLVIQLREPDYDAIAWGTDIEVLYRIPEVRFAVLNSRLARRDYLLQLALALKCPATEQDALAKGLVYVACSHDVAPEMIKTVIRAEVAACLEENTLFRSNSVASKMYKFYSRIVGIKYLYHCIARVVLELEVLGKQQEQATDNPKKKSNKDGDNEVSLLSVSMELDTEKDITDDADTDTNLLQLQLICQKILTVLIKTSLKNIPSPLRQIFVEIDQSVTSKFPGSLEAVYKGLGGLFFLRFVCPAITAPHVYGLLPEPPNPTTQRQLVLITKVIQSIANMQAPGKKEQYMEVMGSFIETSIPRIKKFYDNLREAANINTHTDIYERTIVVPENVLMNGLAATQTILVNEAQKVKAWATDSWLDITSQQDLVLIVDECLSAMGDAPKKIRKQANPGSKQTSKKKLK